jgi:hypothetical protein
MSIADKRELYTLVQVETERHGGTLLAVRFEGPSRYGPVAIRT